MMSKMTKEEAILCIKDMQDGMPSDKCGDWVEALNMAIVALKQQEQRMGHWCGYNKNDPTQFEWHDVYTCSSCGRGGKRFDMFRYCPMCGIKMRTRQNK